MSTNPPNDASAASLSDRVRSLRLPEHRVGRAAPTGGVFWKAASILLCGAVFVLAGLLWTNKSIPQTTVEPAADPLTKASAAANALAADSTQAAVPVAEVAASGDVVLESKGYVIPAHQILVSPKVSGMIVKLFVEEGKRVKKGDVLAELEDVDYQAEVRAAQATLEAARQRLLELEHGSRPGEITQAKAELAEVEEQLTQLESEWKRDIRLRTSRSLAEREFEQSESAYKSMARRAERLRAVLKLLEDGPRQEKIAAAGAEVKQAEAQLAKMQWKLSNCTIRAPISGTILKKNAEEGNIVNPVAFNGSYSLCDMADLADLEVDLTIQERDISKVFVGQKCKVRAEAYPTRVYTGVVSRLMPIADRSKGAVPVRVKLTVPPEEEGVYLKPEMGAVVAFLKGDK